MVETYNGGRQWGLVYYVTFILLLEYVIPPLLLLLLRHEKTDLIVDHKNLSHSLSARRA